MQPLLPNLAAYYGQMGTSPLLIGMTHQTCLTWDRALRLGFSRSGDMGRVIRSAVMASWRSAKTTPSAAIAAK